MKNKNCGIYGIVNKINSKIYIGSSKNLERRKRGHFNRLRKNNHYNKYLQRSYNKHKENNFEFIIIEFCKESALLKREQYYINYYNSSNHECGYNLCLKANKSVISLETRIKISNTLKEKYKTGEIIPPFLGKKMSPESIEKARQKNLGKKLSEEHKRKIGEAGKGRKLSEDHKKKLLQSSIGNKYCLGRKHSEETRKKISIKLMGNKNSLGIIKTKESIRKNILSSQKYVHLVDKWKELNNQGFSLRKIAKMYNVDKKTVKKYINDNYLK